MNAAEDAVRKHIEEGISIRRQLLTDDCVSLLVEVAQALVEAYRNGNKVILFGNGGSAADAQHLAAEMVGKYQLERAALPAIALTTNTSSLTAIGNDYGFERIFARQIEAIGAPGDVAIGISTSGRSRNVLLALDIASAKSMLTIGLTGGDGGLMKDAVDFCVCVPSKSTPCIQEAHIMLGHVLCEIVECSLSDS